MTIEQMHDGFDLLQDKYESPYFTTTEKDYFINLAQDMLFSKLDFSPQEYLLQKGGISRSFESSEVNINNMKEFIVPNLTITLSSGLASFSDIDSAIGADSLYRVISVADSNGNDLKFVRHNDVNRHNRNKYLKGTTEYPIYTIDKEGIRVLPNSVTSVIVTALRKHNQVNHSSSIDSEFSEHLHHRILFDALILAGVPIKDSDVAILRQYDRG